MPHFLNERLLYSETCERFGVERTVKLSLTPPAPLAGRRGAQGLSWKALGATPTLPSRGHGAESEPAARRRVGGQRLLRRTAAPLGFREAECHFLASDRFTVCPETARRLWS